jgi:hypothetical protein
MESYFRHSWWDFPHSGGFGVAVRWRGCAGAGMGAKADGRKRVTRTAYCQSNRLYRHSLRVVTGLAHQFLLSFLGAASGIVAALLLGIPGGLKITAEVSLCQLIGYNLPIVAAVLVLRVLLTNLRSGERRSAPGGED